MSKNLPNDITKLSRTRYITTEANASINFERDPNLALILDQLDAEETELMRLPPRYSRWI